jgi:hypothetical protein
MAVALAVIVLLGVGLPAGGWLLTRRKKFWTADKTGWIAGNDDLDRWLADQFHLSWTDRDRVRAAVLLGRKAPTHLQVPVRELAAAVLANQFKTVRRTRWLFWLYLFTAVLYLADLITMLVVPGSLWLRIGAGVIPAALVVLNLCRLPAAQARPNQIRRNAERALTAGALADP